MLESPLSSDIIVLPFKGSIQKRDFDYETHSEENEHSFENSEQGSSSHHTSPKSLYTISSVVNYVYLKKQFKTLPKQGCNFKKRK